MSNQPFQAPNPQDLAKLLPQYDIEFFIAQGGMGAVYKGRQRSLDRDIAIKVLPHEVGKNEEFRESFNCEAKAMAKLNHPNLLGVFDFGNVGGMPYIVMEYVEGGSLYQACHGQAVEPTQAAKIVMAICDGLTHAHEHNIVHRDIKPANILLTPAAVPKVADFGLAQAIDSDQPGLVMGTPGYTAPEVFQDPDQAGKLADIYSVGVILHQLLTGVDPSGSMETPSVSTGSIRLDAIWRKATHINPSQRHPSVEALAKELEKWLESKARPIGAAAGSAAYRPPSRVARPVGGGGEEGSGVLVKLVIIAVLGVISFLAFQAVSKPAEQVTDPGGKEEPIAAVIDPPTGDKKVPNEVNNGHADEPVYLPSVPEPELADNDIPEVPAEPAVPDQPEEPDDDSDLAPGDTALLEKAVSLIAAAFGKRDAALAENARGFLFQLGVHGREAKPDDADALDRLGRQTVNGRIPAAHEIASIPLEARADYTRAVENEESIDTENLSALTRIRDVYVTRLTSAAAETDDLELKKRLTVQAERAKDLDSWIRLLVPDAGSITGAASSRFTLVSNGGFESDPAGKAGAMGWEIEQDHFWTSDGRVVDPLDPKSGANETGKFLSPNKSVGEGSPEPVRSSFARQTIDLSNVSADIDKGSLSINLSFWYFNGNTNGEASEVAVEFLDTDGKTLGTGTTGILSQTKNEWTQGELLTPVPKGARSFTITLNMARLSGSTTNGGFDEVTVALEIAP